MTMRSNVFTWHTLLLSASRVMTQQITPVNWTIGNDTLHNGTKPLNLTVSTDGHYISNGIHVLPLTSGAAGNQTPPIGLCRHAVVANPNMILDVQPDDIVLISCEPSDYGGNIDATQVFSTARQQNVSSVVFFSRQDTGCSLEGYTQSYPNIYTTQNSSDARILLQTLAVTTQTNCITIGSVAGSPSTSTSSPNPSTTSANMLAPATTSTTVAMIVLYSITGLITALFLAIIVTGAVRAHRHPERYGPQAAVGSSRQSRAKGLAKAMLDSLPIVKFGERQDPKPTDHELESGTDVYATSQNHTRPPLPSVDERHEANSGGPSDIDGNAIAACEALGAAKITTNASSMDVQGCSICTEDFEVGQDQRVLPCNHRFHPACVDPWLLNVSGTCPLCRIDLRPTQTVGESESTDSPLAPPLAVNESSGTAADGERTSRRRSIVNAMLGVRRPERLTREQRLQALRDYRSQVREQ